MNRNEVYLKVREHLLAQGARSVTVDENGIQHCAYRGADGKKCAIGVLIPDELYTPAMEGSRVMYILEEYPKVAESLGFAPDAKIRYSNLDVLFLNSLQAIHDTVKPENWRRELDTFHEYMLKLPT